MSYCVYIHTFPNGKRYIGITAQNPLKRWNGGSGYRNQKLVFSAIIKYGWENIKHEIICDSLNKEAAESKEIELIAYYHTTDPQYGYNILPGGDVSQCSYVMSDEQKRKHSEILKKKYAREPHHMNGKRLSPEWKKHISDGNVGKHAKENHHFYGKQLSPEHREKLSKNNTVAVVQLSKDGKEIAVFFSVSEAHRKTGVDIGHICRCCKGGSKTAGGYVWKYAE